MDCGMVGLKTILSVRYFFFLETIGVSLFKRSFLNNLPHVGRKLMSLYGITTWLSLSRFGIIIIIENFHIGEKYDSFYIALYINVRTIMAISGR